MHDQTPTEERETSVTVTHGKTSRCCEDGYLHCTGGLLSDQRPVTNVLAEYT
jgi:hypothetical protein